MDVGRYLVKAHLREGRSVAELARTHSVHRSWLYKLLARYRAEGEAGLAPRSRRPKSSHRLVARPPRPSDRDRSLNGWSALVTGGTQET